MPKRCVAAYCSNTIKEGVSLFKFPKDAALRREWTREVQRSRACWQGPSDSASCVLCSAHFTPDCFDRSQDLKASLGFTVQHRLMLLPSAVPTIFQRPTTRVSAEDGVALVPLGVDGAGPKTRKVAVALVEKRKRRRPVRILQDDDQSSSDSADGTANQSTYTTSTDVRCQGHLGAPAGHLSPSADPEDRTTGDGAPTGYIGSRSCAGVKTQIGTLRSEPCTEDHRRTKFEDLSDSERLYNLESSATVKRIKISRRKNLPVRLQKNSNSMLTT